MFLQMKVSNYFKLLYGNKTPNFTVNDFLKLDILYTELLEKVGIKIDFLNDFTCPETDNTPMIHMSSFLNTGGFDVPNSVWLYHKPPYKPILSNKWVEVTHCSSIVSNTYEQKGAWFYSAKGSNIFINVGRTIVFKDHPDAVEHFLNKQCRYFRNQCNLLFSDLVDEASKQGYDSIQFLSHDDMRCGNTALEILMVNSVGHSAIPTNIEYRTGYNASKNVLLKNYKIVYNVKNLLKKITHTIYKYVY
jgi:hypothetical protein